MVYIWGILKISIGRWKVCFNINQRSVVDNNNHTTMGGTRSIDNCYILTNNLSCCWARLDDKNLPHQKLGHMNFRDMQKIINPEAIGWVPKFKVELVRVREACLARKQSRAPDKLIKTVTIDWCLELVHVDHVGPTQVESIGGKKYIFVRNFLFELLNW